MTKQEFEAWKRHTEASRHHWQVDEVMRHNGYYMIYKGGSSGQFITIDKTGRAAVGTYTDAVPCISDGCFVEQHSRQFANQDEALKVLVERAGLSFLLDIIGIRAYPSLTPTMSAMDAQPCKGIPNRKRPGGHAWGCGDSNGVIHCIRCNATCIAG